VNEFVLEVRGISKRFSGHVAVTDLSLAVPKGAIYGLLGPNGAGKTTTIRMVMNITMPERERVTSAPPTTSTTPATLAGTTPGARPWSGGCRWARPPRGRGCR